MTTIGITGHSNIDEPSVTLVREALMSELAGSADQRLTGVTCLGAGADQIFAEVVLDLGGSLEVVVPSADYFDRISDAAARERCDKYLAAASAIHNMPYATAGSAAYLAASKDLVDRCDQLIAVWDGSLDSGTGQAVAYARQENRDVRVLWPENARRS
jgi:hypothetical protein